MIELAKGGLLTVYGEFTEHLFYDGKQEVIVLCKGDIIDAESIILRIHSHCVSGHIFNGIECDCRLQMNYSQELIQKQGKGIIIWLDQEGKGNGHLAKVLSQKYKVQGYSQSESYRLCGFSEDNRSYEAVYKILSYYNIKSVRLITNHDRKKKLLDSYGVDVVGVINTPKIYEN